MIIAINYADKKFSDSQKFNTKTVYKKGKVDKVIEYSPKDIDKDFYNDYKHILSQKRGGGYWLWKPYIISKTLKECSYGDYIFYCDSGSYYVNKVKYLIDCMEKENTDIMVFELPLIEKQWTKKETLKYMNCVDDKYMNSNQILATYILVKKTDYTVDFLNKYLEYTCNEYILCDEYDKTKQFQEFVAHRHDQSILSLLAKKEELQIFRDPSQYGDRPWEYIGESWLIKYKKHRNSTYPKIVVSHRKENITKFRMIEAIKSLLLKFGLVKYRGI